ncbi:MAG: hypothetical protein Q8O83_04275 [bacterium]|nr:hypothetical protein [bacterium]
MKTFIVPKGFIQGRFLPTVVYVRETVDFHTRLCLFNYFSELFPDIKTGAKAYLWFFNSKGALVASREIPLAYQGQLQFDLSLLGVQFEGTAGVSIVPDTEPSAAHNRLVGTGYYVYYYDDEHHSDASHEWEPMQFLKSTSIPWLCVVRPLLFPQTEIIVMNAYYGEDAGEGSAHWHIALRNEQGSILAEKEMPSLLPKASTRFLLKDAFPDIEKIAQHEKHIGVEVKGTNIQGPFTFVRAENGDFNIHHFC